MLLSLLFLVYIFSAHKHALLQFLLDRPLSGLFELPSFLFDGGLLGGNLGSGLAEGLVLDQSAVEQLILLLAVVDEEVAQVDLVEEGVNVEALQLTLLPLPLPLLLLSASLLLQSYALLLLLLSLLLPLLSLLLPTFLLLFPLFSLLFALNKLLFNTGHPFDLPNLDLLKLVGEEFPIELVPQGQLALADFFDL